MKCPVCKDVTLLMTERKGIEIDYCPECRGIWLDHGELDKMLQQEEKYEKHYQKNYEKEERNDYKKHHDYDDDDYYDKKKHSKKRRKESFMGDIFDIFGD